MTSVLVSNISPALEERHLRELFECCGQIKDLSLTPEEPRLCVIEFGDPAHAQAAVLLSGTPLGDRTLAVQMNNGPLTGDALDPQSAAVQLTQTLGLSVPLLEAAKKRQDEVARTVYVGNLAFDVDADQLRKFFAGCGEINYIKLVGDTVGWTGRFAFIEFSTLEGANMALTISGTVMGDRPIKVGRSNNPIIKQGGTDFTEKKSIDEIMSKVKEATERLTEKVESESRSRSRSRRRKKRSRRSRSRSRSRRRRSRSRRRSGSRSRSRRRSRRRSRSQSREPLPPVPPRRQPPKKEQIDRTGMFFDGYAWQPIAAVALKNPTAVLLAQHPTYRRRT